MKEYTFYLSLNGGTETEVHPLWGDGLSLVYGKESNQEFFRRTLNGPIVFVGSEFITISGASIETEFVLRIVRDNSTYWVGVFHKTDCTFDYDARSASVTPSVKDEYNAILAALDKEFNFSDLQMAQEVVKYDIRPKVQLYVPLQNKCTCLMGNTIFEQECTNFNAGLTTYHTLIDTHHFLPLKVGIYMKFDDGVYMSNVTFSGNVTLTNGRGIADIIADGYNSQMSVYPFARIRVYESPFGDTSPIACEIYLHVDGSDDSRYFGEYNENGYWAFRRSGDPSVYYYPEGSAAMVYARLLLAKDNIAGQTAYPINPGFSQEVNYTHCISYGIEDVYINFLLVETPTKYGKYKDNFYYGGVPAVAGAHTPICKSSWSRFSIWYPLYFVTGAIVEPQARAEREMKGNTLAGLVNALLDANGVTLTFDETEQSSEFLYGTTRPILGAALWFFFVQKLEFQSPAQRILDEENKISLKNLFTFLRDAYRLYWFVENGRLRIEHIKYFINGGDYYTQPQIGIDLTDMQSKAGKHWSFGQNQIKYDKANMPERYEFGWADDVTELFAGIPLNIISGFVEKGRVESINIQKITTDLDFIISNPNDIAKTGFVVLGALLSNSAYKVAYYNYLPNPSDPSEEIILQNGYLAFIFLYQMYLYDLPASRYKIGDGSEKAAYGVVRGMSQEVSFPCPDEPEIEKLVRTQIGDGKIEKITVNLSARSAAATLKLPTL